MGIVSVVVAAIASYAFGAVWYMSLAKPWMAAVGLTEADVNRKDPKPFIISFLATVVVAGMTRHVFIMSGIDTAGAGLMGGLGLGLFIAVPWLVTNYAYAGRPRNLMLIDGGYATIGCAIIGLVLGLMA